MHGAVHGTPYFFLRIRLIRITKLKNPENWEHIKDHAKAEKIILLHLRANACHPRWPHYELL